MAGNDSHQIRIITKKKKKKEKHSKNKQKKRVLEGTLKSPLCWKDIVFKENLTRLREVLINRLCFANLTFSGKLRFSHNCTHQPHG